MPMSFGVLGKIVGRSDIFLSASKLRLRCKMGIQSGANEDQNGRGQDDDSIVLTQTEGARAAGKHESARIGRASCRERGEISVTGVQTCALPIYNRAPMKTRMVVVRTMTA